MGFKNFWEGEFHKNVFSKDRVQDVNLNQMKPKVNNIFEKDE